jgi:hypothetical protein
MRLAVPPADSVEPSHQMIAARAYQTYETKLRAANDSLANWLEAESQLRK